MFVQSAAADAATNRPSCQLAETGDRLANYLIDFVAFSLIKFGIYVVIGILAYENGKTSVTPATALDKLLDFLFVYLIYMVFYFFCEGASNGRSPGKLITRTKAVKRDGSPVTWEDAFMRSLCRIIPFEPISGFFGNPWHDRLTGTMVVKMNGK